MEFTQPPPRAPDPPPVVVPPPTREAKPIEPIRPDFELDTSAKTSKPENVDSNLMDFSLDPLPPITEPAPPSTPAFATSDGPPALDFDLKGLDLDLGKKTEPTAPSTPPHDEHWYDVQQKFDLAKAYQEMGDKDGARDILKEVLKEGDTEQKAQAQKLLDTL